MSDQSMSQRDLEAYLWGAATLLRGLIDAGDYKGFIFPLIFLKRISDVWDEEHAAALAAYAGDEALAALPENHRFTVPDGAHWDDIRATTSNIGRKLLNSMHAIEAANPDTLTGVFGDAEWTNKNLLSDATLIGLIEHFSSRDLSLANLPEDELGNGYEYLIKRFADDSGHTAQEFYTNRTLVHLMARMLDAQPGDSIYDPTCGTGGMLISCAAELKAQGKEHRTLKLHGQERNFTTAAIAKMNLFLHGIEDGHIALGDTLDAPQFLNTKSQLQTFDVVLANPPYSIKNWDRDSFARDPYGRNIWGVPPQGRADYAFIQHIVASMDPETGRAIVLLPLGVLNREDEDDVRIPMVRSGVVEAVVALGRKLFYNAGMESCLLVLRSRPRSVAEDRVLFVDASSLTEIRGKQAFVTQQQAQKVMEAYLTFWSEPGFSQAVPTSEILANRGNLNVNKYVLPAGSAGEGLGLSQAVMSWREVSTQTDSLVEDLVAMLAGES